MITQKLVDTLIEVRWLFHRQHVPSSQGDLFFSDRDGRRK